MKHVARPGPDGLDAARRRRRAASARLRSQTRDLHDRIERNPLAVRLMAENVSIADHLRMHLRLYGYHRPLVERIGDLVDGIMPDVAVAMRDRVDRLRADLACLGADPSLVTDAPLPERIDAAAAVGLVYVLEGSVLGGRIIARHLAERLALGEGTGAAFYADPPAGTHPRWADVCEKIDRWADDAGPQAEAAMIRAARGAFVDLDLWFSGGSGQDPA